MDLLYEIRTGKNTTVFKEQGLPYSEDCCFSLIVGPNYESIDLVATSSDEANIWITGLRLLNQKSGMLFARSGLSLKLLQMSVLVVLFFFMKSSDIWQFEIHE